MICAGESSYNNREIAASHEAPRGPRPHPVPLQETYCYRPNISHGARFNFATDITTTSAQHTTQYQISAMQRTLITREDGYQEWLRSVLGKELGLELTGCTLQLGLDPVYLTSPFMTYINTLPYLRQVVVVRQAKDFLKMMWGGVMCRVYLFLLFNAQPLLSFADSDLQAWDYYARYIVVGFSRADLQVLSQTRKGRKTQHILGVIKVATFEFPPAIMYKRQTGKKPNRYGGEVAVMKALSGAINFTIDYVEPPPGELWGSRLPNGTWNGIVGMQGRGEADLAIANVFITNLPGQSDHQHFSAPFYHEVSCVVMKVPPPMPRWQAISWPFRGDTWLAILIGLFICGPVLYVVASFSAMRVGGQPFLKSLSSSYFYAFAMHLREPTDRQPNTTSSQITVGFLWIYVMVLGISYGTNLTAFLTVTRQPRVIDTFKDFHDSGFSIVGLGPIFGNLMQRSENHYLKSLFSRFVPLTSGPEEWVMKGQAGYINSYHSTTYLVAQINSEYRKPIFRLMKGQKKREEGSETNEVSEASSILVPLNTDHMQGVFYIMLLSTLSALVVFLAELVFGNRSRYSESLK
ncbi:hypothetical protein Pcinc_028940 [Petrolisthes cinctipes]|uniref:Ionotropic glutamate receptor L-glutamate and glycine-binding domain-containing protein n=1 Tax=Petrolisthes cinctipes TaxID=88211 RepID=A0AAE1F215_PETCI|nr:hypothetical protein Pcinc_028940 [Petrolisthes cinctipes]